MCTRQTPYTPLGQELARILMQACLEDFPWIRLDDDFPSKLCLEQWGRRRAPGTLKVLRQRERRECVPLGPQGLWARAEHKYGLAHRPHKLDEVFVETMYPFWSDAVPGKFLPYITVISSGPYGLYALYKGGRFQYRIGQPPPIWWEDLRGRALVWGPAAVSRYCETNGPNSAGNTSCIFATTNSCGPSGTPGPCTYAHEFPGGPKKSHG